MTEKVADRRDGKVGLLAIDNPLVNTPSQAVRAGLMATLAPGLTDPQAKALVIYGVGRTFVVDPDLREFGWPTRAPELRDVIAAFEDSPKPVVAALQSTPLGGALSWRSAAMPVSPYPAPASASRGQVGPGSGGRWRQLLLRLAGVAAAHHFGALRAGRTSSASLTRWAMRRRSTPVWPRPMP